MGTPHWPDEPVCRGQSVSEAFATILTHNFGRLGAWEGAARDWEEIEGVHQVRVAFRRMRSACTTFRPAVGRRSVRRWSRAMRELGGALGPARDLDVLVSEVLEPYGESFPLPGREQFLAAVKVARTRAYRDVRRMLDGDSYARFRVDFPVWCAARGWEEAVGDKRAARLSMPVEAFAAELLDAQEARVLGAGEAADPDDATAMHRLRIECKKLRYLVEFFRGLFDGMEPFIGHLKELQDLLGVMHDIAVTEGLVKRILGRRKNRELLLYAGGLVGWRSHEVFALRDTFASLWQAFVDGGKPWRG